MNYIINGDSLQELKKLPDNSIDAVVTDPPYELGFMGKKWDGSGIAFSIETWAEVLRVLKPGGYLLAFGHSRLFHRLAVAIEDAGFELRDTIMWVYGSGFPKSMNVGKAIDKKIGYEGEVIGTEIIDTGIQGGSMHAGRTTNLQEREIRSLSDEAKQWEGWGTALKPAYEPIVMARKPLDGTVANNVLTHGVGAINIDESRVPFEDTPNPATNPKYRKNNGYKLPEPGQESNGSVSFTSSKNEINDEGRFPANFIHDGSEEVVSLFPDSKGAGKSLPKVKVTGYGQGTYNYEGGERIPFDAGEGSAARFFYQAKASKKDRNEGLDHFEDRPSQLNSGGLGRPTSVDKRKEKEGQNTPTVKNTHPTVKPTDLMKYLIRMVAPKGAVVMDPFMGSGSTGKAAMLLDRDYTFVGIEQDAEYAEIARARIEHAIKSE